MNFGAPPSSNVSIATRGSTLALWQANAVSHLLGQHGAQASLLIRKTTGDKIQDRFLHEIGGKGLFIKELEDALAQGYADLAVHSMKDLPARVVEPFSLACVLKRHSPRDLLILHPKLKPIFPIPKGSVIGLSQAHLLRGFHIATGSLRRSLLLTHLNQGIQVHPIRGNVDTRLSKLNTSDQWDALILAEASLERLDLMNEVLCFPLDPEWFVPSPAQGALVMETLAKSPWVKWLQNFACEETTLCVNLERALLEALGASCTLPIGVHVSASKSTPERFVCNATVLSPLSSVSIRIGIDRSQLSDLDFCTKTLTTTLLAAGVNQVLSELGLPLILG